MTPSAIISISQVAELLAGHGFDVTVSASDLLRVRDLHNGVTFQAALEGNVLYMTVNLVTLTNTALTADLMHTMLAADNGISTSSFRLFKSDGGKSVVALTNFCKLQDMGSEDQDDILSLAGYLMVDVMAARDLLDPGQAA